MTEGGPAGGSPADEVRRARVERAARLAAARPDRPGGRRQARLARTIVLGALVAFAGILWLGDEFGVDRRELAGYLWASVAFVVIPVAVALVAWLVWRAVMALRRRGRVRESARGSE